MIPFIEGVIRVFDRYGERQKRHKARMKYLLNDIGLDELLRRVAEETPALKNQTFMPLIRNRFRCLTSMRTVPGPAAIDLQTD